MTPVETAVSVLRRGGVVACPTETFFGLLADALQPRAVARVLEIKGRPEGEPIALLLPDAASVTRVALPLSPAARSLAERWWPGPLTLVTHAREGLPSPLIRDGRVGLRVPGPSPALDLVRAFGGPLTATSANRSGEPPVRSLDALPAALRALLDAEIDGEAPGGAPSTVVDVTVDPPRLIRRGAVSL